MSFVAADASKHNKNIEDRGNTVRRGMKTTGKDRGVAQLVKSLPSIHKALRLISDTS